MSLLPRLLVGSLACVLACGEVQPLDAPLPQSMVSPAGVRLVLTNAELQGVAAAVRLLVGKSHAVSVAPLPLGEAASIAATTIPVSLGQASLGVAADAALQLDLVVTVAPHGLVVKGKGAACSVQWTPAGGLLSTRLRFGRDPLGALAVTLLEPPDLVFGAESIDDVGGCLAALGADAEASVRDHLRAAVRGTVATKVVDAARDVLATVLPAGWEVAVAIGGGANPIAVQTRFIGPDDALIEHNGAFLQARIDLAVDAPRHACALDQAPPESGAWVLPVQAPAAPQGAAVLRRSVAVGGAALGRFAWAIHRAGFLCRGNAPGLEARLGPNWAAQVAPAVAALVQPGTVSARLWPGAAPGLRVLEGETGARLEWTLPDAQVEIAAPVDGVELVVLRITGTLRIVVALRGVGDAWSLEVEAVETDSVTVDSPLVALGTVAPAALAPLLQAVIAGIFDGVLALPPGFPALVGTARTGDGLWLWLDGGVQQP